MKTKENINLISKRTNDYTFIFLDIDGVLNNFSTQQDNPYSFDKRNVDALHYLLSKLRNPKIILSSSWTQMFFFDDLKTIFRNNNINPNLIIDKTNHTSKIKIIKDYSNEQEFEKAISPDSGRNQDILTFINLHNISNFLIVDDMFLSNEKLNYHQIKTDSNIGLTEKTIDDFFENIK